MPFSLQMVIAGWDRLVTGAPRASIVVWVGCAIQSEAVDLTIRETLPFYLRL